MLPRFLGQFTVWLLIGNFGSGIALEWGESLCEGTRRFG